MCSHFPKMPVQIFIACLLIVGVFALVSAPAYGQDADSNERTRSVSIAPRVTVAETFTDNATLVNAGKKAEQITEISPGIRIYSNGSRVKAYLDYALRGVAYAQNSSPRRSQNALNTFGTIEALDQWMYLDFSGTISQQSMSAFGTQSNVDTLINSNKTEVSSYRLSPYFRGRLGGLINYEARYSRTLMHSSASEASGVATSDGVVNLGGDTAFRSLTWSSNINRQVIDYSAGRSTEADSVDAGLSYSVTPQFIVFSNAGRESSNYTSFDKQIFDTRSWGASWFPTERTRFSVSRAHRSFGETHSFIFEHRTALTVWKLTDKKDMSAAPSQTGLLSNDANPSAPVISGFLSSAVSQQHRQELALTLLGVRDTVTFAAVGSENRRLDTISSGIDDLSTSAVRQLGFSVDYLHRLTPDYSLELLGSQQRTLDLPGLQDATLYLININLTGKVGRYATASAGVRRSVFSSASPYDESALFFNLILQF